MNRSCCFCGAVLGPGPAASILLELEEGGVQQLRAHAECLRQRLHASISIQRVRRPSPG